MSTPSLLRPGSSLLNTAATAADSEGKITVLMHAVLSKQLKLIKWLCKHASADVNLTDEFGASAVHYACQADHLKELQYLHKYGGADMDLRDHNGVTPLLTAITAGSISCAEYLINQAKCDLLATDSMGLNALMRSCITGQTAMVQWLVEKAGFAPHLNAQLQRPCVLQIERPRVPPDIAVSIAATEVFLDRMAAEGTMVLCEDDVDLDVAVCESVEAVAEEAKLKQAVARGDLVLQRTGGTLVARNRAGTIARQLSTNVGSSSRGRSTIGWGGGSSSSSGNELGRNGTRTQLPGGILSPFTSAGEGRRTLSVASSPPQLTDVYMGGGWLSSEDDDGAYPANVAPPGIPELTRMRKTPSYDDREALRSPELSVSFSRSASAFPLSPSSPDTGAARKHHREFPRSLRRPGTGRSVVPAGMFSLEAVPSVETLARLEGTAGRGSVEPTSVGVDISRQNSAESSGGGENTPNTTSNALSRASSIATQTPMGVRGSASSGAPALARGGSAAQSGTKAQGGVGVHTGLVTENKVVTHDDSGGSTGTLLAGEAVWDLSRPQLVALRTIAERSARLSLPALVGTLHHSVLHALGSLQRASQGKESKDAVKGSKADQTFSIANAPAIVPAPSATTHEGGAATAHAPVSVPTQIDRESSLRDPWMDTLPEKPLPRPGQLPLLRRALALDGCAALNEDFFEALERPLIEDDALLQGGDRLRTGGKSILGNASSRPLGAASGVTGSSSRDISVLSSKGGGTSSARVDSSSGTAREGEEPSRVSIDVEFATGSHALSLAAGCGRLDIVQWLVSAGADLRLRDARGHPPHRAAFNCGQWACFHWLFSRSNAHLDDADRRGHTLLHDAAEEGQEDVVLLLLALGCTVDARDNTGRTALMTAAVNGHAEVGAQLLACGADITAEDDDGRDAQTIALAQSRWAMVRLLEDEGEARAREEAEKEGLVGQSALGLDEVDGQTVDWNAVMQAAQALDLDVVEYCSRAHIPLHTLDKSGRTFLQHAAVNGRLEHVRVLVERGKLNIKARQTRAYRVYARSTRGLNAMAMALSRRWLDVYLFLLLHHTLCHDARPIPHIVHRHYDGLKGLPLAEIDRLAAFAENKMRQATNPLIAALRVAWLMREAARSDRIHRHVFEAHAETFEQHAISLLDAVNDIDVCAWILEEPDALNLTVMKVAVESNCTAFLAHSLVDKAMSRWWKGAGQEHEHIFRWNDLGPWLRRPAVKSALTQVALLARIIIFTVFLCQWVGVDAPMGPAEVLMYIFTLGNLIPPPPPSTKRVNIYTRLTFANGKLVAAERESSISASVSLYSTRHDHDQDHDQDPDKDKDHGGGSGGGGGGGGERRGENEDEELNSATTTAASPTEANAVGTVSKNPALASFYGAPSGSGVKGVSEGSGVELSQLARSNVIVAEDGIGPPPLQKNTSAPQLAPSSTLVPPLLSPTLPLPHTSTPGKPRRVHTSLMHTHTHTLASLPETENENSEESDEQRYHATDEDKKPLAAPPSPPSPPMPTAATVSASTSDTAFACATTTTSTNAVSASLLRTPLPPLPLPPLPLPLPPPPLPPRLPPAPGRSLASLTVPVSDNEGEGGGSGGSGGSGSGGSGNGSGSGSGSGGSGSGSSSGNGVVNNNGAGGSRDGGGSEAVEVAIHITDPQDDAHTAQTIGTLTPASAGVAGHISTKSNAGEDAAGANQAIIASTPQAQQVPQTPESMSAVSLVQNTPELLSTPPSSSLASTLTKTLSSFFRLPPFSLFDRSSTTTSTAISTITPPEGGNGGSNGPGLLPATSVVPRAADVDEAALSLLAAAKLHARTASKASSRGAQFIAHVTGDAWSLVDTVIAVITLIVLVMRCLPGLSTPLGEAIYLWCMVILTFLLFSRLFEPFTYFESTGPLLITVYKMAKDVKQFGILFIVPMLAAFFVFYYLLLDPAVERPEGFEDVPAVLITLWGAWGGEVPLDTFGDLDPGRRSIAVVSGVFVVFVTAIALLNLLVGLMANTLAAVADNARQEFASRLVARRWAFDQASTHPPPPLNLLSVLLWQGMLVYTRRKAQKQGRAHVPLCAYCLTPWSSQPVSIARAPAGRHRRFSPQALFEMPQTEAGQRLCHVCLRAQRVLGRRAAVAEHAAEVLLGTLLAPLAFVVEYAVLRPKERVSAWWRERTIANEAVGEERFYAPPAHAPYSYAIIRNHIDMKEEKDDEEEEKEKEKTA